MEILEPKPPGTFWATPCLLRDFFSLVYSKTAHHAKSERGTLECVFLFLPQKDTGCNEGVHLTSSSMPQDNVLTMRHER